MFKPVLQVVEGGVELVVHDGEIVCRNGSEGWARLNLDPHLPIEM